MSELSKFVTTAAAAAYEDGLRPTSFLSSFFNDNAPTNADEIEMDIRRNDQSIAVDVTPCSGPDQKGKLQPYTTKNYRPPEFDEAININACEYRVREFGSTAYAPQDLMARLARDIARSQLKSTDKIERAIEVQARDCLLTGTITLQGGESIDFKRKATHNIQVITDWSNSAADIVGDIDGAGDLVRQDGKVTPDLLILGGDSYRFLLANDEIKDRLNFRRASIIDITSPQATATGGKFHGTIDVGAYTYQLWTYPETYDVPLGYGLPNEGTTVDYVPGDQVIVTSSMARFDKYWAGIYRFVDGNIEGGQLAGLTTIPVSNPTRFAPYAFVGEFGRAICTGVVSRPLCVPTAIDAVAVIKTSVP